MTPINRSKIVDSEVKLKSKKWTDGLIFVIVMWLLSRLVIIVAMQLIAPLLHTLLVKQGYPLPSVPVPSFVPKTGWELFSHWDGGWYRKIATLGYDYANDGQQHTVAFFPLFPLLCRGLMILGLPSLERLHWALMQFVLSLIEDEQIARYGGKLNNDVTCCLSGNQPL